MTPFFAAGLRYFVLVYAAGFAFGVARVTLLVPAVGTRWAELAEMPLMLTVIVLAARSVLARGAGRFSRGQWLRIGLLALAMMLGAELLTAALFQPRPLAETLAARDPVSGTFYLGMLALYAVLPWLLQPRAISPPPPR